MQCSCKAVNVHFWNAILMAQISTTWDIYMSPLFNSVWNVYTSCMFTIDKKTLNNWNILDVILASPSKMKCMCFTPQSSNKSSIKWLSKTRNPHCKTPQNPYDLNMLWHDCVNDSQDITLNKIVWLFNSNKINSFFWNCWWNMCRL